MRIHCVTMAGFGPFLAPQRVDFDAFDDHGIFLINGRTGAGKSSILDAIVYALYNCAPRYGSGGSSHVRSHHCSHTDPTWVELEFSTDGERYRVRRSPEYERPKSRGEGMTTERPGAQLCRWDGDQWVGLEAQVRTVGQRLEELLPLSRQQFLQVVLLAQGEFQRFLVAESSERQDLLGALFDTQRFESFDVVLQQRASAFRHRLQSADQVTDSLVDSLVRHLGTEAPAVADDGWLGLVVAESEKGRGAADESRAEAQAALAESSAVLERARRTVELQRRLGELCVDHARLVAQVEEAASWRLRLQRAEAARTVRPARDAVGRLISRGTEGERALDKAVSAYEEAAGAPVPDDLVAERDHWLAEAARVAQALTHEQQLRDALEQVTRLETGITAATSGIEHVSAEIAEQRVVAEAEVPVPSARAEAVVHELLGELANARRHAAAVDEQQEARARVLSTGQVRTAASGRLDRVRRALHDQAAGRLAALLEADHPCPVCGSAQHPEPAVLGDDQISEDDLARCEDEFATAQEACAQAEGALAAVSARVEALAGSRTVEVLSVLVAEGTEALAAAQRAEEARDQAVRAVARGTERLQSEQVRLAGLEARLVSWEQRVQELTASVDEARGGAESVAERLAELESRRGVVEAVLQAQESYAAVAAELVTARQNLEEVMAHVGLTDDADFLSAHLPEDERSLVARALRDHDDAWAVTAAGLSDPQLVGLPGEPVDLAGPELRVEEATNRYRDAAAEAGVAGQRHETTSGLVARIREVWARNENDRREYEVLRRLADTVHGDPPNTRRLRLESYVLAVQLEQIVEAANHRLAVMSAGRYELMLSDRVATRGNNAGLEVRVLDQHTQESRTPESLSGGEKFLASLSLALGLAEVVTNRAGGITLDTLFIDEGFGSLDAETLDLAMHTLDSLRQNGRTVGVISHVEAMKERIPAQVVVERAPGGWSTARVSA